MARTGKPELPIPASRTMSFAVLLGSISGMSLFALALLAVVSGELGFPQHQVVVVVVVDALIKLVLAVSLVVLSRFAARRLPGAVWGTWLIGALCVPYLAAELLIRIPGLSVQLTLPGANVLNTTNLRQSLAGLRPSWHPAVDTGLTVLCLAALLVQMSVLISAIAGRGPAGDTDAQEPTAPIGWPAPPPAGLDRP